MEKYTPTFLTKVSNGFMFYLRLAQNLFSYFVLFLLLLLHLLLLLLLLPLFLNIFLCLCLLFICISYFTISFSFTNSNSLSLLMFFQFVPYLKFSFILFVCLSVFFPMCGKVFNLFYICFCLSFFLLLFLFQIE